MRDKAETREPDQEHAGDERHVPSRHRETSDRDAGAFSWSFLAFTVGVVAVAYLLQRR